MIRINNSLTNSLDEFKSMNKKTIKFYTCGPTIYNDSHFGHARTFITFDIIRRLLESFGYDVQYGMNITDIDDKILNKVKMLYWRNLINDKEITVSNDDLEIYLINKGKTVEEMTPTYEFYKEYITNQEKRFWEDMDRLNNLTPTYVIRVSDVIPDIIEYINTLVVKGYAYESNGSVYINMEKYLNDFSKTCLYTHTIEGTEISTNEGFNDEKRNIKDFVLWKNAKKYEISFNSPWGFGRPGWHIECSVMIHKLFDSKLDIHGGGIDLKFPHHNNEYIQTSAFIDNPDWVNYFLHSGHLNIQGEKMSQSLNNFQTIRQILELYTPRQIRLLCMLHRWDSPMDLNNDTIKEMIELDTKIDQFMTHLRFIIKKSAKLSSQNNAEDTEYYLNEIEFLEIAESVKDNFNIPLLLKGLREYINKVYVYMSNSNLTRYPSKAILQNVEKLLTNIFEIFGLRYTESNQNDSENEKLKDLVIDIRDMIRKTAIAITDSKTKKELFSLSDSIRDVKLPEIGLTMQDTTEGIKIVKINQNIN